MLRDFIQVGWGRRSAAAIVLVGLLAGGGLLSCSSPQALQPGAVPSGTVPSTTFTLQPVTATVRPAAEETASMTPAAVTSTGVTRTADVLTPQASPTLDFPRDHYIINIRGHKQYFPLGCETSAAKDWSNYFNKDFNEFEFQYRLPLSDNPDFGFVGDVNSPWGQVPPYGYGVYAGPIADLLSAYGITAHAYKGYSLEQVKYKIAQDIPVIAWVIGNVVGGVPTEYTDHEGNKTVVAAYEHVVIVTGYSTTHIRYMSNGKFYDTPNHVFLNSWAVLGNMVVVDQ